MHRSEAPVHIYRFLTSNRIARRTLRYLSRPCRKDGADRLEVALEMFAGSRKRGCSSCRLVSFVLKPFLAASARSFGSDEDEIRTRFTNPYWRKGLKSVIKGLSWFGTTRPFVPGAPFQVVWNVTRACNLKCVHCYANAGRPDSEELSTKNALKVIDILAEAGVVILSFSGGEPTIRPDILQLIRPAHGNGMYVGAASNGIVFSSRQRAREFKQNGLEFVQISVDGAGPYSHDLFRGSKGCFDRTVEGVKNCVAEGYFVEIAATATKYNHMEIPAIVDLAEDLKANWFMMYNFVPTGRGRDIIEADLTPEERERLLQILWQKMKTKRVNVLSTARQFAKVAQEVENVPNKSVSSARIDAGRDEVVIPTHFYNPHLSRDLKKLADFIGGCGADRFYIALEPNGDIYPCVFFPRDEYSRLGNMLTVDFENMWRNSELLWKLRNKGCLKNECGTCVYRYTCGGCRARAYNYFGDVLAPDPGCTMNEAYWGLLRNRRRPVEVKAQTR